MKCSMAAMSASRKRSHSARGIGAPNGGLLAEQLLEEPVDVPGVVLGVEPLRGQVVQYVRVLDAVRGLLAHEPLDVLAQLGVA